MTLQSIAEWWKAIVGAITITVAAGFGMLVWADGRYQAVNDAEYEKIRQEVITEQLQSVHAYDFYTIRQEQAESDLIELEELEVSGIELTPTQERKSRRLEEDLSRYDKAIRKAVEDLTNESPENSD